MKLSEFIQKYIKTKVDFDNYGGAQCVDLVRQYWKDVGGIKEHTGSCASSGGAKDLFLDYSKMPLEQKYFDAIRTTKIKYGDVAVWSSTEKNKYGHIAIAVTNATNESILVFEQNGFTQDGAKLVERPIENILGILRFKGALK